MDVSELRYAFPEGLAAQHPAPEREDARLLLVPASGDMGESTIRGLAELFTPGDVLVLNESRVMPARLLAAKESGGRVEILAIAQRDARTWLAMVRASRSPRPGTRLVIPGGHAVTVLSREEELFVLDDPGGGLADALEVHGSPPLPPYIRRAAEPSDTSRYQTTFAVGGGAWGSARSSVAAPTAGLHLTPGLLERIERAGATVVRVALGVGPGTFRPIEGAAVEAHRMHEEAFEIGAETARVLASARSEGHRVTAVGTTALRAVEAAATRDGTVRAVSARTALYAIPGTPFRVVSRLLTNFHRPESTLLALVAAFAGTGRALGAHEEGVRRGYRLFSYGDAMLVERAG